MLSNKSRTTELEVEAENILLDVIIASEVKLEDEDLVRLESYNMLYYLTFNNVRFLR